MKKLVYNHTCIKIFLTVVLCCLLSSSFAGNRQFIATRDSIPADVFNIKNASFLLPQRSPSGKYSSAFFLLNVVVPADWTHDIIKAPMFCYAAKYTLPKGFNVQASLSTLFISSRLNFGPFWNYSINNYHFAVGYQFAYNYGVLNQFGFHTKLTGWEQQPSITAGYSFKTTAVTMRADLYYTQSFQIREGHHVIPYDDGFTNGYSITTSVEQRLWKNRVMSFGFKWNYLRYHILAWPAFPVNKYKYNVPEFQLGLNF